MRLTKFTQAYELDSKQYLSLFYRTMLSPISQLGAPADQAAFRDALLNTIRLNKGYAPAYVELARLAVRQGNPTVALAIARKAEQLEPSRAGYHLLSGTVTAAFGPRPRGRGIRQVCGRSMVWTGSRRGGRTLGTTCPWQTGPPGDPPLEVIPPGIQTMSGLLKSASCGEKGLTFDVDHDGQKLTFRTVAGGWIGGYSKILRYSAATISPSATTPKACEPSYVSNLPRIRLTQAISRRSNCGRIYRHHWLKRRPKGKSLKPIIRSV